MQQAFIFLIAAVAMCGLANAQDAGPRLCEPWDGQYAGEDATGEHVIALWQFMPRAEDRDGSGHGHDFNLDGATISTDGPLGSCLECYPGWPVEDKRHAARVADADALSPKGAFTLEMWIKPKPELEDYPDSFLLDKKYVSDTDYQMILTRPDKTGLRRLRVVLGFGEDSQAYSSQAATYEPGVWRHVAFTYDGAGSGRFFRDGLPWGGASYPERGAISPGDKPLSIGDRLGSYYHGFPGFIDQVRLSNAALEFRRAGFALVSDRTVFVRMEADQSIRLSVTNLQRSSLSGAVVRVSLSGMGEREFRLPEVASAQQHSIAYPLNTSLRPGEYQLTARLEIPGEKRYHSEESFPVIIVPRPLPRRMPVVMWGVYSPENVLREMDRLKRLGFTHVIGTRADYGKIFEAASPTEAADPEAVEATKRMLNEALANGISIVASLSPGSWLRSKPEFLRVNRDGQPYEERQDICGLFPEISKFCYNVGASVARTYGDFPALDAALLHTEVRGHAQPCFHEHDREAFRRYAGIDIPDEVRIKSGVRYEELPEFPESRVIPDDHPIYQYYRWYWKRGDGWNGLNSALHRGLKSTGREDMWTFHDPAVRVASVYGSGGQVDVISQWTYTYPDPVRIGLATDELLAMAAGADHSQRVMKMTQIIWYRNQTAPPAPGGSGRPDSGRPGAPQPEEDAEAPTHRAAWEQEQPDAPFITIAPMHLREAFWTKIARPITGIMYHGWQSLVPVATPGNYRHTHPQTKHELARLVKEVLEPLGPTLLQVPAASSDVALLESFAAQMFARRGTYGWGRSWLGDVYHILQYAQLPPEIIYDETVMQQSLDRFRVLVMGDCDVITETMADRIEAFQDGGGLIVGDERLALAIKPDMVIELYERTGRADEDKAALLARAAQLRDDLDGRYSGYLDSANPQVITRLRRYGTTDYVFAVNDHREFGEYVGHHGRVMENGLPSATTLTVGRDGGFVYDLVDGCQVPVRRAGPKLRLDLRLGPCEGRVFMMTEQEIAGVHIEGPEEAVAGRAVTYIISVLDGEGLPVDAVVPIRVDIRDPDGRQAEFSGYYGAANGELELRLDIAANDTPGIWQIRARELASRKRAEHYVRVRGE